MPAPPLSQLARKACIKNVNSITDIGDAEYSLIRPVLLKLQNPKQLHQLEQNCPQIIGADAELWRDFCKRDIANYEKTPKEPANPKSWYKCYLKLSKAAQKEIDADAALLKATMDGIKNKQAQNTAQQVELRGVKVPTGLRRNLPQIALPQSSSIYREMGHKKEYSREPVEKGPPKAVSTLAKIRRETVAQRHFAGANKLQRGIIAPVKTIPVVAAPRQLVEQHQKAKIPEPIDPMLQSAAVFNPRKRRIEHVDTADAGREAREKRLKAFTNPSNATPAPISSNITPNKATTAFLPLPKADFSVRQALSKLHSPQRSSSQSRTAPNASSPARPSSRTGGTPGSTVSRANTSSPQIRPPMRINRPPANPLMAPKRRPIS